MPYVLCCGIGGDQTYVCCGTLRELLVMCCGNYMKVCKNYVSMAILQQQTNIGVSSGFKIYNPNPTMNKGTQRLQVGS